MSKQNYTEVQIKELLTNPSIKSCTSKYITFTDDFKIKALELDKRYFLPKEIFKEFGFPKYIIDSDVPGLSLRRWRLKDKKGILLGNKKGKQIREKIDFNNMTLEQEIEYLKVENALLKEMYKLKHGKYP